MIKYPPQTILNHLSHILTILLKRKVQLGGNDLMERKVLQTRIKAIVSMMMLSGFNQLCITTWPYPNFSYSCPNDETKLLFVGKVDQVHLRSENN